MPFQVRPKIKEGPYSSYTYSHLTKGPEYHARFEVLPGRRLIWRLEQEVLEAIAADKGPFSCHLDFAGGTARIASILRAHCEAQIILDISSEMLAVAREKVPAARIIQRDFSEGVPELGESSCDLVTAFRFFPNAEPELREDAMRFIASKVKSGGYLICNNHRSFWSLPWVARRLSFRGGTTGMANGEMVRLAQVCGLRIVGRFSMGILPQTEQRAIVPWTVIERLEQSFFRLAGKRHGLGYNVVFVFVRV